MAVKLRIGSRPSALALAQAGWVKARLEALVSGLVAEVVAIKTTGDKLATASLARIGGKGLFIRELEAALSAGRIDLAVHSMKDLPAVLPAQYRLAAVPVRENPCDALLTVTGGGWAELPTGARLGTSSARRRLEALRLRPDLKIEPLRGNVDTRLSRLAAGDFDAMVLAMAGLKRLGRLPEVRAVELDEREFIPAAGQGALALEVSSDGQPGGSAEWAEAIAGLNDADAEAEVTAERAFLATIGASCVSPVGVKATVVGATLTLRSLLFSVDGTKSLADAIAGSGSAAAAVGSALGQRMIAQGAQELIGDD